MYRWNNKVHPYNLTICDNQTRYKAEKSDFLLANQKKEMENAAQKVFDLISQEERRQQEGIELIASENYQSKEVLQVQSSVFANKYAEGFP